MKEFSDDEAIAWAYNNCKSYSLQVANGDPEEAQDLLQFSISSMWKAGKLQELKNTKNQLGSYVNRSIVNRKIDLKRRMRVEVVELHDGYEEHVTCESNAESKMMFEQFMQLLNSIEPYGQFKRDMEITMMFVDGMKYREIAAELDMPHNSVSGSILRFRNHIERYAPTFLGRRVRKTPINLKRGSYENTKIANIDE